MKILAKRKEKWGIDVDVQFVDEQDNEHVTTMRFDNDAQIDAECESRINKKIAGYTEDYNAAQNIVNNEKLKEKLDILFEYKNTITKKEYDDLKEESKKKLTAEVKRA